MIQGSFEGQVGTITVQIDVPTTHTADIISVGTLQMNIDITPDGVSIDSLQTLSQKVKVSMMQYTNSGIDLHDVLRQAMIDAPTPKKINATFLITKHDDEVFEFPMEIENGNFQVDDFKQTVDVTLTSVKNEAISVDDVFAKIATGGETNTFRRKDVGTTPRNYTCAGVFTFVKYGLREIFGNNFDLVARNENQYFESSADLNTGDLQGFISFVIVNYPDIFTLSEIEQASGRIACSTDSTLVKGGQWLRIRVGTNPLFQKTVRRAITDSLFVSELENNAELIIGDTVIGTVNMIVDDIELNLNANATISTPVYRGDFVDSNDNIVTDPESPQPFRFRKEGKWKDKEALDVIKTLAGGSGSFFGCAFSKNFFISRLALNDTDDVTLGLDDVESLRYSFRTSYLNSIFLRSLSDNTAVGADNFGYIVDTDRKLPNLTKTSVFLPVNQQAEKDLAIDLGVGYPFLNKGMFVGGGAFFTASSVSIHAVGSGYTPGTYNNVALEYATGEGGNEPPTGITQFQYPNVNIQVDETGAVSSIGIGNNRGFALRIPEDLLSSGTKLKILSASAPAGLSGGTGFRCGIDAIFSPQDAFWDGDYDGADTDQSAEFQMLSDATLSYEKALTNPSFIEFTVIGSDIIKPWNTIVFDGSVPEKFQNRRFRATSISYDFVGNKAKIKAYEVT